MTQRTENPNHLLSMRKITKRFPGVLALKDVDFDLIRGEVHVLMGANGAGKSTLMKVLSGVYRKDSGELMLDGETVEIESSRHAQELGISIIHQHFSQVPHLSVAENIFLGREKTRFGLIDYRDLYARAEKALEQVGLEVDVRAGVGELSVSQRQMIEIAKALSIDAKILIMDEPTSALTKKETERLFEIIGFLKEKGLGVIYISHRMEELKNVGTRVTVMRDGGIVGTLPIEDADMSVFVKMMIGKDVKYASRSSSGPGAIGPGPEAETVIAVENLSTADKLRNVGFTLRKGEILGLFGLMGSGRTELARAVFGVDPITSGRIILRGREMTMDSPGTAVKNGLGFLTEDRLNSGLAMSMSVGHNITLPSLLEFLRFGVFLDVKKERDRVETLVADLKIKTPGQDQPVQFLSGGNQQKVVFAKWIMAESSILILDDPTQGIDVEAKEEVHRFIVDFTRRLNRSIVLISSELPEILSLCDRILVLHEGRLAAEFPGESATQESIMSAAVSGKTNN